MALMRCPNVSGGSGGGWDETGTGTMSSSGVTVTLQKKPQFVYGELLYSASNLPLQYFFVNIDGEYVKNTTYSNITLRPDYSTYGKGNSSSVTYDGDKTITFKQYQAADSGLTLKWWALYAE